MIFSPGFCFIKFTDLRKIEIQTPKINGLPFSVDTFKFEKLRLSKQWNECLKVQRSENLPKG